MIIGTMPICVVGLLFQERIETTLRSLWVVGGALIAWSVVMLIAPRASRGTSRTRRGATRSSSAWCSAWPWCRACRDRGRRCRWAWYGFDRVTVTRLSFFLSIPALLAARGLQAVTAFEAVTDGIGRAPTIGATGPPVAA